MQSTLPMEGELVSVRVSVSAGPVHAHGGATKVLARTGYLAVAAAVVHILATLAGSVLDPSYSQIRQHVSDLTATSAPTWAALAPLYLLYNVLAGAFAVELYRSSVRSRLWQLGTVLLLVNAFAGVMMVTFFREDVGGLATTFAGAGHLVFAGLSSLVIVFATFVYAVAFRRSALWGGLSTFSFAIGVGFAILGPIAAFATAEKSDLAGLAERGPIGLFLVWLFVVGSFVVVLGRPAAPLGVADGLK